MLISLLKLKTLKLWDKQNFLGIHNWLKKNWINELMNYLMNSSLELNTIVILSFLLINLINLYYFYFFQMSLFFPAFTESLNYVKKLQKIQKFDWIARKVEN